MSCQLESINHLKGEKPSLYRPINPSHNLMENLRVRLLRPVKRAVLFVPKRLFRRLRGTALEDGPCCEQGRPISAGDIVRVRPEKEIRATLDDKGRYKNCFFMSEMYEYCGKEYEVQKELGSFFDEARQKMAKAKDMVILKDVQCHGNVLLYREKCDRFCFFFWHKDWLCKIDRENAASDPSALPSL